MFVVSLVPLFMWGCSSKTTDSSADFFPEATSMPAYRGNPSIQREFSTEELFQNCAVLHGGPEDIKHHNLVIPYRGHLVMPWAPEWGRGGFSLFDMQDPCTPQKVGEGFHERMRETHAVGFQYLSESEQYAVATGILGIQFWDFSVLETPTMINYLQIDGVFYPDSYTRVVLSVFWQYPYVYAAASDNGFFIVDATDPHNAQVVTQYQFDPPLRAAAIYALGNQLFVSSAEGSEAVVLDISDPVAPQPIGGGRFQIVDENGEETEAYHASMVGNWGLFARKENGGGVIAMDISDPTNPTYAGSYYTQGGNGGYVFYHEGFAFVGDSHWAKVIDMRDLENMTEVGEGNLAGDLDTITPFGNVAILSVDDEPVDGVASVVMPWKTEIDSTPPVVLRTVPVDGEQGVALTSRVGIAFSEMMEPTSIFAGSIQMFDDQGNPVDGWGSAQETIAHYIPKEPLLPGRTYTVYVMEGGARDSHDNALAETLTFQFTTAGTR